MGTKILLVEDDREIAKNLALLLRAEGFAVTHAGTQSEAVRVVSEERFDLALVDISLPDGSGFAICTEIRQTQDMPVIFLTASGDEASVVTGLNMGADDYITKPFNILELKARIRALLRRAGMTQQEAGGGRIAVGHIVLDTDQRSAWKGETAVELTAKEFDLMELLIRNPGRVYSRENLLNIVWGYEYAGDYRTVDVHVRRLREKLELDPANPEFILTKWGVGYYLKNKKER